MKLVPLADRVVLKQLEAETKTKTGIILTSSAQEKPQEAEVVAVGPGTDDVKMEVTVGQKVFILNMQERMLKGKRRIYHCKTE